MHIGSGDTVEIGGSGDVSTRIIGICSRIAARRARPAGFVPHYLPGTNDQLFEFADKYGIPHEAVLGGQETLYPEYKKKLRELLNKQTGQAGR